MGWLVNVAAESFLYASLALGLVLAVPLNKSKKFREVFFARFCLPVFVYLTRNRLNGVRKRVVSQLNELVSHDDALKEQGVIRLLEIGAGFGANLEYITREVSYWNVEPNGEFDDAFLDNLRKHPNVKLERWIHGCGEDMRDVPDGCIDAVLITYVLCTVTDVQKVLAECRRVLAEGGRLLFLEHVAHPEGSWAFTLQELMDPLWSLVFGGCHATRRTRDVLIKAGFAQLETTEELMSAPSLLSPQLYGFAVENPEAEPHAPPEERGRYYGNLPENERQALMDLQ